MALPIRIAFLCDLENVSPTVISCALKLARKMGTVAFLEGFAGHSNSIGPTREALAEREGMAIRRACDNSKNAADIALGLRAVEIAARKRVDTFVIVSSDDDLRHSVHHLRQAGKRVIGMGSVLSGAKLRDASDLYVTIDNNGRHSLGASTSGRPKAAAVAAVWENLDSKTRDACRALMLASLLANKSENADHWVKIAKVSWLYKKMNGPYLPGRFSRRLAEITGVETHKKGKDLFVRIVPEQREAVRSGLQQYIQTAGLAAP